MLAWEIKNKYIYTLHGFSAAIVEKEWEEYKKFSTDDFAFVTHMLLHRVRILEKYK